jgi:general secretion pathway protein G
MDLAFSSSFRSRAFTLLELLTVVATVGVLAALLVPAFKSARTGAHLAKCSSNLRQIAAAGILYSQDHEGKFSSSRLYNSSTNDEPGLKEYFDGNGEHPVFTCPALASYGIVHTYTLALVATCNSYAGYRASVYRNRVQYPAKTAWMMDGTWMDNSPSRSWFSSYMTPFASDLARLVYPHNGKENVLFVDGHVELVGKEALADTNAQIWTGSPK